MKRAVIGFAVLAVALIIGLALKVKRSGTWAEVELMSIQAAQDGQIKAEFMICHPSGRGVDFTLYVDGEPVGGGGVMGSSSLGFSVADSKGIEFDLNPEHAPVAGSFTNSPLFRRLLVSVGKRLRIGTGKPLDLYNFTAADNHRYQMIAACDHDTSASPEPIIPTPEQTSQYFKALLREAAKGNDSSKALDEARPSAPYLSDFVRLFPSAEVNYRTFGGSHGMGFDLGVDLHERYELLMQLPVRFDSSNRSVIGYGEPQFYLLEVERVELRKGRTGVTLYNPTAERKFGSTEWKKIVESGGDFGAIGYRMITNQPVAGFKDRNIEK